MVREAPGAHGSHRLGIHLRQSGSGSRAGGSPSERWGKRASASCEGPVAQEQAPRAATSHWVLRAKSTGEWEGVGLSPRGTPRDQTSVSEMRSLPLLSTQCYLSFCDPVTPLPLPRQHPL